MRVLRQRTLSWLLLATFLWPVQAWSSETTLRVAFVYNFIKFIEWPKLPAEQNITLCVLDHDTEVRHAVALLDGKKVGRQSISVTYLSANRLWIDALQQCEMVYLAGYKNIQPNAVPSGVVVVADEVPEEQSSVCISLRRNRGGRIEFTVNSQAVRHSGVKISSQLLKLAKNAQGDGEQGQ